MRAGRKTVGESMVIYLKSNSGANTARFGFVVSKSVGSAVQRNLVKRRLRAAIMGRLQNFDSDQNLVIRALPSAKDLSWLELGNQIDDCVLKAQNPKTDSLIK